MQYILQTVWTYTHGTWCNGRRNVLTGNNPEKVSNVQKTNQRATNETRKEGLKSYTDMTL